MENTGHRRARRDRQDCRLCEAIALRGARVWVTVLVLVLTAVGASSCSRNSNSTPTGASAPQLPAAIALSGNLAFGPVAPGLPVSAVMTISNSGTGTLTWSGITTGNADFTASPSSGSVAPGGSASVSVTYRPTTLTSYSGVLTVQSNAASGTDAIALSGRGGTAILSITGTNIIYSGVPTIRFAPINIGMSEATVLTLGTQLPSSGVRWPPIRTTRSSWALTKRDRLRPSSSFRFN